MDSEVQDSNEEQKTNWEREYGKLLATYYKLRLYMANDIRVIATKLRKARESPRSESLDIMRDLIISLEEIDKVLTHDTEDLEARMGISGKYDHIKRGLGVSESSFPFDEIVKQQADE